MSAIGGLRLKEIIPRILLYRNVATRDFSCACRQSLLLAKNPAKTSSTYMIFSRQRDPVFRTCSSTATNVDVSYEKLKQLLAARDEVVVIDVREPWELREYGQIPGSVNVPLGQVDQALKLDPKEFKEKYGSDMPSQSENIIFSCLAGVRSKKALDIAVSLGYSK
ncbi:TSTD3 protein, partial [Atractosteus spatula]|nr:TSTD3 protein [Atractosteus spatula]